MALAPMSRYVLLHYEVMNAPSIWSGDTTLTQRNHAHRGPVFLHGTESFYCVLKPICSECWVIQRSDFPIGTGQSTAI